MPEPEFLLTRVFDAPRHLLFSAWTKPEHLNAWWGPKGFHTKVHRHELRPGGVFHYGMQTPQGQQLWGKWVFREVTAPARLVFVASFADEQGNPVRHPFVDHWPLETLSTIDFDERGATQTALTMRGVPIEATEEECRVFEDAHEGMRKGWAGTLDQLEEHVQKHQKPV